MKTYTITDSNSDDSALTYGEARDRITEWYEDVDSWDDGNRNEETHAAVAEAIAGVPVPPDEGGLDDLETYANAIAEAVAKAMGGQDFAGHGNYFVSAAAETGMDLEVTQDTT